MPAPTTAPNTKIDNISITVNSVFPSIFYSSGSRGSSHWLRGFNACPDEFHNLPHFSHSMVLYASRSQSISSILPQRHFASASSARPLCSHNVCLTVIICFLLPFLLTDAQMQTSMIQQSVWHLVQI